MSSIREIPTFQVELVRKQLRAKSDSRINMFDPCCGEGRALSTLARGLGRNAYTYGIEADKELAAQACERIGIVLYSAYEDTRVTPLSMGFMWLCPPVGTIYDAERTEVTYLRDLTECASGKLMHGGLLAYCVNFEILSKAACLLSMRFEEMQVFSLAGRPYDKLVVVFGYRAKTRPAEPAAERERLMAMEYGDIPPINMCKDVFEIPTSAEVHTFQANTLETEEVAKVIAMSSLWSVIEKNLPKKKGLLKTPLAPLNAAHTAVTIAAGAVGGTIGSHVLVGATERTTDTDIIPTEGGVRHIITSRSQSIVRVFDKNGIHVLN